MRPVGARTSAQMTSVAPRARQEKEPRLPQDVVEEKWVPGEANAVGQQWSLRAIQAQVKQRQRWDSKVVELKEQIWTGADAVEEATDIATAVD